ncbi:MAG: fumarate hydratase C-terminal domain-containing protein [Methanomicrobia archaeon]|nr:fumarate hydratase C-terminal domain-containing protein [Methanomicrobia archaeon]HDM22192.1 fumarate hydratase [Methanomicrobia archaeon]
MILKPPISKETVRSLKLGDSVYITGKIYTLRDEAHKKALEEGLPEDINLKREIIFHCGPIIKENQLIAAGPTTSSRMNDMECKFIKKYDIAGIIGKGGMDRDVLKCMEKNGTVYLSMTGGCALLPIKSTKLVKGYWKELGMPEAIWILECNNFGPLTVSMVNGKTLYRF